MPPGPQTRALTPDQIRRLEKFRMGSHEGAPHGYSLPLLRTAMGAQFGWRTLKKALQGRPVSILHHAYIVQWMERFLAVPGDGQQPLDWKSRAAGERDELEEFVSRGQAAQEAVDEAVEDAKRDEEAGTTRTVRGSR